MLLEKGAEVKLCVAPDNITIRGIIIDIEDEDYIIDPIKESPDEETEIMKINKYDSNIKIIDVNNTCQPETKTYSKFLLF